MIAKSDFLTNVGFLVLGTLIAIFTTILSERIRRPAQGRDLAQTLYEELADRVARCCFDYEAPWQSYLSIGVPGSMSSFRLRKFSPEPPIVFPAVASQLAILEGGAPQALIRFYYCLAAWKRDVDNLASEIHVNGGALTSDGCQFLAKRLKQTLRPGLNALEILGRRVEGWERIDAAAIAGYDEYGDHASAGRTLRERLSIGVLRSLSAARSVR